MAKVTTRVTNIAFIYHQQQQIEPDNVPSIIMELPEDVHRCIVAHVSYDFYCNRLNCSIYLLLLLLVKAVFAKLR